MKVKFMLPIVWACLLCSCHPSVTLSTVHPDSDKTITFKVDKGTTEGTVTSVKLNIEGSTVANQPGTTLSYTGGAYPAYSNQKLKYTGIAGKSDGSASSAAGWVYIANPKNVFTFPSSNGSNHGYPNSTTEQTGANLYRLDKQSVRNAAQNALMEYANSQDISVVTAANVADEMVAAVALYVDQHMSYREDALNRQVFSDNGWASYSPGWDFPQPADLTLTISGNLTNASPNDDFQGDCEDHAILRASLLRALGFAPWAIWNTIDNPVTHEYNIVLYEGAYRLMDYGRIGRWLQSHSWDSHKSHYGWNETNGPRSASANNHQFLKENTDNFPGGKACNLAWSYEKYYKANCQ